MRESERLFHHSAIIVAMVAAIVAVVAGLVLRLWIAPDIFQYSIWSDRDLLRGWEDFSRWRVTGSELSYGPSTPGGTYYFILALIQAVSPSPRFVYLVQNLMDSAAMLVVAGLVHRYAGGLAALCAAAIYAISYPVISVIAVLWNPGFLGLPAALVLLAVTYGAFEGKRWPLLVAALMTGWASQIHVSFLAYGISAVGVGVVWRRRNPGKTAALVVGMLLLTYLPYLAREVANGGKELRLFGGLKVGQTARPIMARLKELGDGLVPWVDPVGPLAKAAWIGNATIVVAIIAVVVKAVPLRDVKRRGGDLGQFLIAVMIPAVMVVALVSARGGNRYYIAEAAAMSALIGMGLATLLQSVARMGRLAASLALVPALGFGLFVMAAVRDPWFLSNANSWDLGMAYGRVTSVLGVIRDRYGIAGEVVEERVAVLDPVGQGWGLPPVKLSYLLRHDEVWSKPVVTGDRCVLVGIASTTSTAEKILRDALADIPGDVDEIFIQRDAVFVGYRPLSGNCRKNLKDRYLLTATEMLPYQHWDELSAQGEQALALGDGRYIFRVGHGPAFVGTVTLTVRNGGVDSRLDSNHLQGKSWASGNANIGILLRDVALIFTREDTATAIRVDTVGDIKGARLGPWTGMTDLSPGVYRVNLSGVVVEPGQWRGLTDADDVVMPMDILISPAFTVE